MPYIPPKARADIIHDGRPPTTAGELNFAITNLITRYAGRRPLSYDVINEVVGVLECAKLELYRRLAAPYEDEKRAELRD